MRPLRAVIEMVGWPGVVSLRSDNDSNKNAFGFAGLWSVAVGAVGVALVDVWHDTMHLMHCCAQLKLIYHIIRAFR